MRRKTIPRTYSGIQVRVLNRRYRIKAIENHLDKIQEKIKGLESFHLKDKLPYEMVQPHIRKLSDKRHHLIKLLAKVKNVDIGDILPAYFRD